MQEYLSRQAANVAFLFLIACGREGFLLSPVTPSKLLKYFRTMTGVIVGKMSFPSKLGCVYECRTISSLRRFSRRLRAKN